MRVHLAVISEADKAWIPMLENRAMQSRQHKIVPDAGSAGLILLLGPFALMPERLIAHELYKAFPERCAVYTEEDHYLPLLPGIYCSARKDEHTRIGRVFSYTYLSRNGRHHNPFLAEVAGATPVTPSHRKRYLFTFQGGSTSLVRKKLFNLRFHRDDVLIENTSAFHNWDEAQPDRRERQHRYAETLAASHFVLCPRGAGPGSIRFFEVMAAGVAPVLIADDYELPPGPRWDEFLVRVPEREIAGLPAILEPLVPGAAERGRAAQKAFFEFFSVEREFDSIVGLAARALHHAGPPEPEFRKRQPAMIRRAERRRKARSFLRNAVLRSLEALRLKNPYQMNR
jgi:hypothetical protein